MILSMTLFLICASIFVGRWVGLNLAGLKKKLRQNNSTFVSRLCQALFRLSGLPWDGLPSASLHVGAILPVRLCLPKTVLRRRDRCQFRCQERMGMDQDSSLFGS